MDVRSFPWFNRGDYTPSQIKKLQAVGTKLLAENESYKTCAYVKVAEVVGTTNPEVKGARVTR